MSYYCEQKNNHDHNDKQRTEYVMEKNRKEKNKTLQQEGKETERLRKKMEQLETKRKEQERRAGFVKREKETGLQEMHELFHHIKENDMDRAKVKLYLMEQLSDEQGDLDEYRLREMLDYLNKRIFQVYYEKEPNKGEEMMGSRIRRKKLLLKHDEEPEKVFTLTLMDPITKKRYTKREILQNIVDAIDAYVHEKGEWRLQEKKDSESGSSDLESFSTSTTSLRMKTERENKTTTMKCCAASK